MARVFFSAGEASGDAYAAALTRRLPAGLDILGVGGPQAAAAGMTLVSDSSRWGAVGIYESLKVVPRVTAGYRAAFSALAEGRPGVFVPIDYGFMNVRLARHARRMGWKVVYFIPPGSWRKDRQGADLPEVSDTIITPFAWSADILRRMGADAHWFGHPLKQLVYESRILGQRDGLAVLPGSRDHEVTANLDVIAQATERLDTNPVRLAASPNLPDAWVAKRWATISQKPAEIVQPARRALWQSRAAIVCSGTATLEAALAKCPCVVIYRGSHAMRIEFAIRKPKFDFISLPNILLGRGAVTELLGDDANPDRIGAAVEPLLAESQAREEMLAAFAEVDEICGPADALDRSAALIAEIATTHT